jgi:hypothetical protein
MWEHLPISGGTIDNTSAGAITTVNYPLALNGDFTFTGTQNLNLGTGATTLSADRQIRFQPTHLHLAELFLHQART